MPALTPVVARFLTKTKVFHEDDVYPPPLPVLLKDTDFPLPVFESVYASTNIGPARTLLIRRVHAPPNTTFDTPPLPSFPFQSKAVTNLTELSVKTCRAFVTPKAAFAVVAPDFLDMSVTFTKQDPGAMDRFKAKMYTQFPNLYYYEQDWALQGFTTDLLKRKKDAMRSLEKSTLGGRQSRAKNGTKK
ncbi:hypothetical protein R3P38DRAFT_3283473 [Favolaschia claudopus]|uniref:Uncharacterized protein n=1 Tax=Favolaschia claudopus TaxID=2862362 RepID=A0AAV9ZFQ6_9AGAR